MQNNNITVNVCRTSFAPSPGGSTAPILQPHEMLKGPSPRRSDASKKKRAVDSAEPRRNDTAWLIPSNPSDSNPMSPSLTTLVQCK